MPLVDQEIKNYRNKLAYVVKQVEYINKVVKIGYTESLEAWLNIANKPQLTVDVIYTLLETLINHLKSMIKVCTRAGKVKHLQTLCNLRINIEWFLCNEENRSILSKRDKAVIKLVSNIDHQKPHCFFSKTKSRRHLFNDVLEAYCDSVADYIGFDLVEKSHQRIKKSDKSIFTLNFNPLKAKSRVKVGDSFELNRMPSLAIQTPAILDVCERMNFESCSTFSIQLVFDKIGTERGISEMCVIQDEISYVILPRNEQDFITDFPKSANNVTTWTHMAMLLAGLDKIALQVASFEKPFNQLASGDFLSISEAFDLPSISRPVGSVTR